MARRTRTFFTDKQKSDFWNRWERGDSVSSIGRLFEVYMNWLKDFQTMSIVA
jgi:hypothetical protein